MIEDGACCDFLILLFDGIGELAVRAVGHSDEGYIAAVFVHGIDEASRVLVDIDRLIGGAVEDVVGNIGHLWLDRNVQYNLRGQRHQNH